MKIVKSFALAFLSILLFLFLSIFGAAFMLNRTALNPDFVTSEVNRLNFRAIAEEQIKKQSTGGTAEDEFIVAITNTLTEAEPLIKENIGSAIHSVYDYLLGRKEKPELAVTLRQTFLSSDFAASLIDTLDVSSLAGEFLDRQLTGDVPPELASLVPQLDSIIADLEPTIKQELIASADPIFDYLVGETTSFSVSVSLAQAKASLEDSIYAHLGELPTSVIAPYVKDLLTTQITNELPPDLRHLADNAIPDAWVNDQVNIIRTPILNYLTGKSQRFNVVISTQPVVTNLKEALRAEFLQSPPPEAAGLSPEALAAFFDNYFQLLASGIPSTIAFNETTLGIDLRSQIDGLIESFTEGIPDTYVIDESVIEPEVPAQIAEGLAEAEEGLGQARRYIAYFQLGYRLLPAFMVLLIVGIILISRQVKYVTRTIGITFLTYGVISFADVIIGKLVINKYLGQIDAPSALQEWLPQFVNNVFSPLQMFGIGILIAGVGLLIVSFVYKSRQS